MALPQIKLDERTFQDLVDEAKLRIPRYTPEWTNHNVSDPGVTLIELFAYMVDQLLYQVNRVPEKNYRSFLDLIGVNMAPPNAAQTEITFVLSAAQPHATTIPKGTEVATVRTESSEARIFTTLHDLVVVPPGLKYVLTTPNSQTFTDQSKRTFDPTNPLDVEVFQQEPQPGNAFYLGFTGNINTNTLVIGIDAESLGVGINPHDAPVVWEYWDELQNKWISLDIVRDTTEGLTIPYGEVEIYIPLTAGQSEIAISGGQDDNIMAFWIRCRYNELGRNQHGYNRSPLIHKFTAYSIGGTVNASHSQIVRMEELGRSNGEASQTFQLSNVPMLALNPSEGETVLVEPIDGRASETWKQVPDFAESGTNDKHFVCDTVTGEISFGPIVRSPLGQETQRGAVPPFDSRLIMTAYRTGGGTDGNVGSNTITVLKSSIPYVSSVYNRFPASGGTNPESLQHAMLRGPSTLRARNRAVTAEDFESLTREATSGVARVRCLTPKAIDRPGTGTSEDAVEPGTVVLMVVPEVDKELRELRPEHLNIPAGMRLAITSYLDERRLLTTNVELVSPKFQWITVQARIKTANSFVNERVKREAERRLYSFIRPVQGGPDPTMRFETLGDGWPFGRVLYISEIFPILQTIEGVEFVEKVEMFPVTDVVRGQAGSPIQIINPGPKGVLCSYRHQIVII